jgi:integrase
MQGNKREKMKSSIKTGLVFVGGSIVTLMINDVYPLAKAYILNKTIPSLSVLNPLWIVEIIAFCVMGFGMFLILKEKHVQRSLKKVMKKITLETKSNGYPKSNYLSDNDFEAFLWGLERIEPFHDPIEKQSMSANRFVNLFKLMRECNLKISEALDLRKKDFDFEHKIITIRRPNSDKVSKTIVFPKDEHMITRLLNAIDDDERKLFPTNSDTVYHFAIDAGRLGGIEYFQNTRH